MTATATRVEKIRKYLEAHEAELEAMGCGFFYVDFAGPDVTIKSGRVDRLREPRRDTCPQMD